ncbi:tetratricopeptide repeat protein [Pleomorphomonas sp. PLEO]|uniref:tetratricopeptide repeat protein n=1 Tax=Pleomorphomonas sp. PLEO TaxID=3239306 RepID=UPI00351E8E6D
MLQAAFSRASRLFSAGNIQDADAICKKILSKNPGHIDSLNLRAVICCRNGRFSEGAALLEAVLRIDRQNVQALDVLGDAFSAMGRFAEAADCYLNLSLRKQGAVRPLVKRGAALYRAGNCAQAAEVYLAAINISGTESKAYVAKLWLDYATLEVELDNLPEAESALRRAISLEPNNKSAILSLSDVLCRMGEVSGAAKLCSQAISAGLRDSEVHYSYGRLLFHLKSFSECIAECDAALAINPGMYAAHCLRGSSLRSMGRLEEAEISAREALRIQPDYVLALIELGTVVDGLGRHAEALEMRKKTAELEPSETTLANLALSFENLGETATAIEILEGVSARYPDNHNLMTSLACIYLRNQMFDKGWSKYAWRIRSEIDANRVRHHSQYERWQGQSLASGRLLVWGEQGVGDEVMFSGLIPQLLAAGIAVTLECDPRLVKPLARSFPQVECFARTRDPLPASNISAAISAGDLFELLRPDRHADRWLSEGFLRADEQARSHFRERYAANRPLVGISWRTSNPVTGHLRSLRRENLHHLVASQDADFVSLQYGNHDALRTEVNGAVLIDGEVDQFVDLDLFIAQVSAMDAVVTVDNTTAHVAGALNIPTLLLLPFAADWRWFRNGGKSSWYPSVMLLRQTVSCEWEDVVEEAKKKLSERFWL